MFTETYIEMVTKAKEIQGLCKYKKGDWLIHIRYKELPFVLSENASADECYNYCTDSYKWLPTLEDLIWMIDKDIEESNLEDFMMWCRLFVTPENAKENTLEYIMEVYYCKEWNPEKRVWEESNGS